jgi:hypothetical protein
MRLVIGGPARDTGPTSFAHDLAYLFAFTREHGPWTSVDLEFIPATYVHVGREAVLERAITQWQATHLLWLDTDMRFPQDAAIRLAEHHRSIVAVNCVMRDPRMWFTAKRDGQSVETTHASTGLEPVEFVGFGVMLMRTDVVSGLLRPWFEHGRNAQGQDIGEDATFCRKLRVAGHQVYIDHDLSKEVGHVGLYDYRLPASVHA